MYRLRSSLAGQAPLHNIQEDIVAYRLCQQGMHIAAFFDNPAYGFGRSEAGAENHRRHLPVRLPTRLFYRKKCGPAIHPGHSQIHKEKPLVPLPEEFNGLAAVLCNVNFVSREFRGEDKAE